MHKLIIITLLFVTMVVQAQKPITFQSADSISYQCYMIGDWDKLINFGNEAILQGVEFKTLYQRMGYAYFVKQNYFAAQSKYEKALKFDESDDGTRLYLYYCGINTGDDAATGFHASKLTNETKQKLGLKPFKIVSAVDVEYNYKKNLVNLRSNPNYYRLGISTQISQRLSLYQTLSQYSQTVNDTVLTTQKEYYGALNYMVNQHSALSIGYHYVSTKVDTQTFPGNMFFAKLSTRVNRFQYEVNSSILMNSMDTCTQIGVSVGYTIPGTANIYLKSSFNGLRKKSKTYLLETNGTYISKDSISTHIIFTQAIGAQILKPLWVEANVTLGNLKNYNDNNGLYLYNSLDATLFRTGLTAFLNINKKITFVGNYTYDKKELIYTDKTIYNYNQHSFSTGIIWKL